ncbi:MAG: hypothetical protein JWO92_1978 [Chitinophagaceae bacterium]|nr:hypothetical protein [Chitinophagaceae bacterium]
MKKFLIVLLSGILTLSVTAQTLTITFNGTNNSTNRNRGYQVVLDGTSYYSNSNTNPNTNTNVSNDIVLTNQQLGSHTIAVYRLRNNNSTYNNGANTATNGNAIYSNTFQLRQGYDMTIAVNGNGQVTFSEKRVRNRANRGYNQQNMPPMADATFNQLLQTVRGRWLQSSKLTAERDAFLNTTNYFTTEQVRQLLLLISSEPNRLALAKLAYPRVVDAANFTQLYSVFNSVASRNDLDTFIRNNPNNNGSYNNNGGYNNNNNNSYRTAMADYQFNQLLQTVNSQYNQSGKYTTISGAFNNNANYFSTSQIRQLLSVINAENDRLALAKQSYLRVSDPVNFTSLYDLLYNQASRNDLNNYVVQNGGNTSYNNTQYNTRIPMPDYQFTQLLQKAGNHLLPWDKVRDVREAFNNSANYFSTSQIRQLLSVVSSENDKLELAKLAWNRVTDPGYFTQLFDLFSSQANRDDLNAYIQAHPF